MYEITSTKYEFKYLTSSISGDGIKFIYLPEQPDDRDILDFDGKWNRTELPLDWQKWKIEEENGLRVNPDFIHPKIEAFVSQEWTRRLNGVWFWNTVNGERVAVYITGLHYFYLCWWVTLFDNPTFRDTDKEIFYFLQRNDEDPCCYGTILGTIRRYGKSAILGCWLTEPITRERRRNAGMQGETDTKIAEFYTENVLYSFRKLPDFFTPVYNEASTLRAGIEFSPTISRGKNQKATLKTETLDSKLNYGSSDVNYYNRAKLYRYGGEESAKVKEVNVYDRHDAVKSCMKLGVNIYGKMFYATTADEDNPKTKPFEELFFDSDFDAKGEDGETKSGLYAVFLPAQYGYEGFFDEYGIPRSEEADRRILLERKKYEDEPAKLIKQIRKYPRTIPEYFYTDSKNCQFNVKILNERKNELILNKKIATKATFNWLAGKKNGGKVTCDTDNSGKFSVYSIPDDYKDCNLIRNIGEIDGVIQWEPINTHKYVIGVDPIDFVGLTVGSRRSKPAAYVIRKYDTTIDGLHTDEEMYALAAQKHRFKTGYPIIRYAYRPDDPKIFYEYIVRLAVYFGCQVHIEQQKMAGLYQYMETNGYFAFIMNRPEITHTSQYSLRQDTPGTPASKGTTNLFTGMIASNVTIFGHMYPFLELIEDLLEFDPNNTTVFDDTVAFGFGLMGAEKREYKKTTEINLPKFFQLWDNSGSESVAL